MTCRSRYRIWASAAAVALSAGRAWAEPVADSGGLPQFDVSYFPGQIFWLAISFLLLYLLMAYAALPKVRQTQEQRRAALDAELEAAAAASARTRDIIAQYEQALSDARAKAHATVNDILTQASRQSAARQEEQRQMLQKKLRESERKIAATRDAALKEVRGAAADLAGGMIEKMTGVKMRVQA